MSDADVFRSKVIASLREVERLGPATAGSLRDLRAIAKRGEEHPYNGLVELQKWLIERLRELYAKRVAAGVTDHLTFPTLVDRLVAEARNERGIYYLDLEDFAAVVEQAKRDRNTITHGALAEAFRAACHLTIWYFETCVADGEITLIERETDPEPEPEQAPPPPPAPPEPPPPPKPKPVAAPSLDEEPGRVEPTKRRAVGAEMPPIMLHEREKVAVSADDKLEIRIGAAKGEPERKRAWGWWLVGALLVLLLGIVIGFLLDEMRHRGDDETRGATLLANAADADTYGEAREQLPRLRDHRDRMLTGPNVLAPPVSTGTVGSEIERLAAIPEPEERGPIGPIETISIDGEDAIAVFLIERAEAALTQFQSSDEQTQRAAAALIVGTHDAMGAFAHEQFTATVPINSDSEAELLAFEASIPQGRPWRAAFNRAYRRLAGARLGADGMVTSDAAAAAERDALREAFEQLRLEADMRERVARLHGRADEAESLADVNSAGDAIDAFVRAHPDYAEAFDPDREALASRAAALMGEAAEDALAVELLRQGEAARTLPDVIDALDRLVPFVAQTERYSHYQAIIDRLRIAQAALELLREVDEAVIGDSVERIDELLPPVDQFGEGNPDWAADMELARQRLHDRRAALEIDPRLEALKRRAVEADEWPEVNSTTRDIADFLVEKPQHAAELAPYQLLLDAKALRLRAREAWTVADVDAIRPEVDQFVDAHPELVDALDPVPEELTMRRDVFELLETPRGQVNRGAVQSRLDDLDRFRRRHPALAAEYNATRRKLVDLLDDLEADALRRRMDTAFSTDTIGKLTTDIIGFVQRVPRYNAEFQPYLADLARRRYALQLLDDGNAAILDRDQPAIARAIQNTTGFLEQGNAHARQKPELEDLLQRLRDAQAKPATVRILEPGNGASLEGPVHTLKGTIVPRTIGRVLVEINGREQYMKVGANGQFEGFVVLTPGSNTITVTPANDEYTGSASVTVSCRADPTELWVQLTWDRGDNVDLDLYVTDPRGDTVYFNRKSRNGGELDVDNQEGYGPEHYALAIGQERAGWYDIRVHYYEGERPVHYNILILWQGQLIGEYEGSIAQSGQESSSPGQWTDESWAYVAGVRVTGGLRVRTDPSDAQGIEPDR